MLTKVAKRLPTVPLDRGVASASTGVVVLDVLPLVTMGACLPMVLMHLSKGRVYDAGVATCGFLLAVGYHMAHMAEGGLSEAELLGMPGSLWRTLDILFAQGILLRTLGHALGVRTRAVALLSNLCFPMLVVAYSLATGRVSLAIATRLLALSAAVTTTAKLLVEGPSTLPRLGTQQLQRTASLFLLAFLFFPLPEAFPDLYWLFHSLWHVAIAAAFWCLYEGLDGWLCARSEPYASEESDGGERAHEQSDRGCSAPSNVDAPAGVAPPADRAARRSAPASAFAPSAALSPLRTLRSLATGLASKRHAPTRVPERPSDSVTSSLLVGLSPVDSGAGISDFDDPRAGGFSSGLRAARASDFFLARPQAFASDLFGSSMRRRLPAIGGANPSASERSMNSVGLERAGSTDSVSSGGRSELDDACAAAAEASRVASLLGGSGSSGSSGSSSPRPPATPLSRAAAGWAALWGREQAQGVVAAFWRPSPGTISSARANPAGAAPVRGDR